MQYCFGIIILIYVTYTGIKMPNFHKFLWPTPKNFIFMTLNEIECTIQMSEYAYIGDLHVGAYNLPY